MDLSKYYGKGITGLENLGNTCFLNSCMQVLNHAYELNHLLDSKSYERFLKPTMPDSNILLEWNDLREVMWSGNGVVGPNKFVHNVHRIAKIKNRDIFTGWVQNDMTEFLLFFMDCMHNSISRSANMKINGNALNGTDAMALKCYEMLQETYKKEYSEIMNMFYGIYVSEITSKDGKKVHSMKPENYFILDLPVIDGNRMATNLYGCFELFTKSEIMEGENAWFNETTGKKEDVSKQITFWNFPDVLVLSLKRFTPDGMNKINSLVEFPLEDLDLSKFARGYKKTSFKYNLFGVCNHMGGVMGGHYTAFVKNAENKWLHCNDTNVTVLDDLTKIVTPMAYCLFYRKKNNLL